MVTLIECFDAQEKGNRSRHRQPNHWSITEEFSEDDSAANPFVDCQPKGRGRGPMLTTTTPDAKKLA